MSAIFKRLIGGKGKELGAYEQFSKKYILTDVVLGTGSYAEVRKGKIKTNNENVAVKIVDKTGLSKRELQGLLKEVKILRSINHRNVVKFYDFYEEPDIMYVVMEFVGGGELFDKVVQSDAAFSENDVRKIIKTLAEALQHCNEKGVIHRDIKPQNLLLTKEEEGGELKLADFNLSIQLDPESIEFNVVQTMCGTPNYVAPEVLSGKPYDFKCDIWSLGVICFVVLSGGCLPFFVEENGEIGKQKLLRKVMKGRWGFYPPDAWVGISEEAKDFLRQVMEKDPDNRLDYESILEHPWILDLDKNSGGAIDMSSLQKMEQRQLLVTTGMVVTAANKMKQIMTTTEEHGRIKKNEPSEMSVDLIDEM